LTLIETSISQLRFAASMLFGIRFSLRSLDRLIDSMLETRHEFGHLGKDSAEIIGGPNLDESARRELQVRRFRKQAVLGARETVYYADLFKRAALDPTKVSYDDISRIPHTSKGDIREHPDAFARRTAKPALRTTTTGTTGKPTSVVFSAYELSVAIALGAMAHIFEGSMGPEDICQINTSSRATLGNMCGAGAAARVGAVVCPVGLVDPEITLTLLTEPHQIPGKKPKVSVMTTYPSYLGELVEHGLGLGYKPADFGLERINVGGEVVTKGLLERAQALFGSVQFSGGYAMTEIWPFAGRQCEQGHLHFEPTQGLLEVRNHDTGAVALPGGAGTIVGTPFAPYRDATVVLRYDTQDVVRVLPEAPTCSMKNMPATSDVQGKLKLSVQHDNGWTFVRDVAEALERLDEVPLPARYSFRPVAGGVGVQVVTRFQNTGTRRKVEAGLEARGVPLQQLDLLEDCTQLHNSIPLRGDLRELSFGTSPVPTLGIGGMLASMLSGQNA
jgi:phenylacetate-CoA ligase